MNTSQLIKELVNQQKVLGLDDATFASRLGISRPQWSLIRAGKMRPGMSLLAGVAQTFPGLKDLVLEEISGYKRSVEQAVA